MKNGAEGRKAIIQEVIEYFDRGQMKLIYWNLMKLKILRLGKKCVNSQNIRIQLLYKVKE